MSQKLKRNKCPQCGTGDENATWLATHHMLCMHCGFTADISKIDSSGDFNNMSPWYELKLINKRNLTEYVHTVQGLGVICIVDCLQLYEKGTRRDDVVRKFDRLESSGQTDMDSSFITRVKGDKVVFLRGSFQSIVTDGAGWHNTSSMTIPENMRLVKLPPYSPELNPVEHLWDDLREKSFHNKVFKSIDALEQHLSTSLHEMELDNKRVHSIVAWPWIINSLLN